LVTLFGQMNDADLSSSPIVNANVTTIS